METMVQSDATFEEKFIEDAMLTNSPTANRTTTPPISIALSRDELLVVLEALSVETIPGIDVEPTGDWTVRERGIARMVAVRSLRARGLVQLNNDQEPQFHTDLLRAVGICAHSQSALFLFHWPNRESTPIRTFGHARGTDFVLHARPDDELHFFTLVPTRSEFLYQILARCGIESPSVGGHEIAETKTSDTHVLRLPSTQFAKVRAASTYAEARNLLVGYGVDEQSADALANSLIGSTNQSPHDAEQLSRISILQTIQQTDADTIIKRDFTVLEDAKRRWLIAAESTHDETPPLLIKSTTREELFELLNEWL